MNNTVIVLEEGMPGLAAPLTHEQCASVSFFPDAVWGEAVTLAGGISGRIARQGVPASVFLTGTCSSTFDLAWHLLRGGELTDWASVVAYNQEKGKGQLGRHWHSPPGNVYVSFLLPEDPLFGMEAAALVCGYMVLLVLRAMRIPVVLKWPNDLLLEGGGGFIGKVAGLLLEERQGRVVAGLGINVREAPDTSLLRANHAIPATSLADAGRFIAPVTLWLEMLPRLQSYYTSSVRGLSMAGILADLERGLAWKGERVRAGEPGREFAGTLKGLGPRGELLVETREGLREITSGSVALGEAESR